MVDRYHTTLVKKLMALGLVTVIVGGTMPPSVDAYFQLDASLTVSETYTDNLFFTPTDEEEDFGTIAVPSVSLSYHTKDVRLRGTYTGAAQFFVNHPSANSFAQFTNFNIDLPFLTRRYKGLEVKIIETFNFSPQIEAFSFGGAPEEEAALGSGRVSPRTTDTGRGGVGVGTGGLGTGTGIGAGGTGTTGTGQVGGFGPIGGVSTATLGNQGVFTRRSNAFQNLAGIDLRYAWSPRVRNSLGYRNRLLLFTSDDFQDSMTHQGNVSLGYRLFPRTELELTYQALIATFLGAERNSFTSHIGTIGASHRFSRTLFVRGNVGAGVTESQIRLIANGQLTKQYERGQLLARYFQTVGTGGGLAATATLSQNFVGIATRTLTRRLSGFLQAGVGRNTSLSGNVIDLLTFQGGGGVTIRLLEWLNGSLGYSYINQKSDGLLGTDAQVNQVFFALTARMYPWRFLK